VENARFRRQERAKYQGDIQDLAQYLRKRDPRVAEISERQKKLEAAKVITMLGWIDWYNDRLVGGLVAITIDGWVDWLL
jgi:hypothetical protein